MEESKQGDVKLWLDCDPGHDDAMAIILAGHTPNVRLLGISTAAGNQTLQKTTNNALRVLACCDLSHVEVIAGQAKPLMREVVGCPEIHGESGLDTARPGASFPLLPLPEPLTGKKAVIHMYDVISQHEDHSVTLVATACLTNVALLFMLYPEVVVKLKELVLLGGCLGVGNTGPVAEFNIQLDPEAAKIVFETKELKIVQVPLEVSHTCLVTSEILERLRAFNSPFGDLMVDLLLFFAKTYKEVFDFDDPPLHDPLAVAYAIKPALFQTKFLRVDIETLSELSAGQTVVDIWKQTKRPANVHVAMKADIPAFWEMMMEAWQRADKVSPLNTNHKEK